MAMEIITKLKRDKKILITVIVILSLLLSGMVVRYMILPDMEYTIEKVTVVPGNLDLPKRKKREIDEHNRIYQKGVRLFS